MQKKLIKTAPWFVASMTVAATAFGAQSQNNTNCRPKSYDQGADMSQGQMMAAYNAPARIDVRGSWDLFVGASYVYWQPTQDNMDVGVRTQEATIGSLPFTGSIINRNANFYSGFQVMGGMNFDHDEWDSLLRYTRVHGSTTTSAAATSPGVVDSFWGTPDNDVALTNISSRWRVNLDTIDWEWARAYYNGMNLTFRPHVGVRAAWINQKLKDTNTVSTTVAYTDNRTTRSWGVGLRTGLDSNWIVGQGFRFYGKGSADLLFTRYTKLSTTIQDSTTPTTTVVDLNGANVDVIRPHADLEVGVGYGTYFDNNNWHFDLTAGYDFQVFWNQNMFRRFFDDINNASSLTNLGNLYIQGLTVAARFDF